MVDGMPREDIAADKDAKEGTQTTALLGNVLRPSTIDDEQSATGKIPKHKIHRNFISLELG